MPTSDGAGGWIPAPFVPGYAKAPALAGASAGWAHRESNPGPTGLVAIARAIAAAWQNFFYQSCQPHQPHQERQRLYVWTAYKSLIYSHVAICAVLVFMRNENDPRALKTPSLWREPINEWMAILKAGNLSSGTLIKRSDHVRRLARAFPEVSPEQIKSEQLLAWVSQKSWQPETRHSYYSSMRMFFAYIQGPEPNAATVLPRIRRTVPPPRPCPENVLADALDQAPERERLIIILAASVGLRVAEIVQIHIQDIEEDLYGRTLRVRGKGARIRLVPLLEPIDRLIIRACINGDGYAFPGQIDGHLSAHHASKVTNQYLQPPWTLHTLRHRFATKAYAAERDLIAVQNLLGHQSVATTQRYAAAPNEAAYTAAQAALPSQYRLLTDK